jgi:hypothetical protein
MQRARLAGVVILLALSGCEDEADNTDDMTEDASTQGGSETADRRVDGGLPTSIDAAAPLESFQALYAELIVPRCQDCHGTVDGGHTSARLALVPKETALEQLIYKPDQSLFLLKLNADPRCGTRMPRSLDGGTPDYLSDPEVLRIRRWIEQGALNN